jgi:hypothetical protein
VPNLGSPRDGRGARPSACTPSPGSYATPNARPGRPASTRTDCPIWCPSVPCHPCIRAASPARPKNAGLESFSRPQAVAPIEGVLGGAPTRITPQPNGAGRESRLGPRCSQSFSYGGRRCRPSSATILRIAHLPPALASSKSTHAELITGRYRLESPGAPVCRPERRVRGCDRLR